MRRRASAPDLPRAVSLSRLLARLFALCTEIERFYVMKLRKTAELVRAFNHRHVSFLGFPSLFTREAASRNEDG